MSVRRKAAPTSAKTDTDNRLTVRVHGGGADRDEWHPRSPRQGWTPASVSAAAIAYAEADVEATTPREIRRLAGIAQRSLFHALAPNVKRSQIRERLRGKDHLAAYFDGAPAETPDPALAAEDEDEARF